MIKNNFISQTIWINCAKCGLDMSVSNSEYNSETFELISDGTFRIEKYENSLYLWFHCGKCNEEYRLPFKLENHT